MIQLTIFTSTDARIFDGPADNDLDAALIVLDVAEARLPKFKNRITEMRDDPELTLAAVMAADFISTFFTIVTMNRLPHASTFIEPSSSAARSWRPLPPIPRATRSTKTAATGPASRSR